MKKINTLISVVIIMAMLFTSAGIVSADEATQAGLQITSDNFTSSTSVIEETTQKGLSVTDSLIYGELPNPLHSLYFKDGAERRAITDNAKNLNVTDGIPNMALCDISSLDDWAFMNGKSADSGFENGFDGLSYDENGDTYVTLTYYLKGSCTIDEVWVYCGDAWGAIGVYELYASDDSSTLYSKSNRIATFVNTKKETRQKFCFSDPKSGSFFGIKILCSIPYSAAGSYDNVKQYCSLRITELAVFGQRNTDNALSPLTPVDFSSVEVTDEFWGGRQLQGLMVSLPACVKQLEGWGAINNFRYTIAKNNGGVYGTDYFDYASNFASDSDVYKVVEGICYAIQNYGQSEDAEIKAQLKSLTETMDEWIELFLQAQDEDGYLNTIFVLGSTTFSVTAGREHRFQSDGMHELYCMGHFYEMAVAHYYATGETRLLDAALKNADMVYKAFYERGEDAPYKPAFNVDGHPEVELALVKLSAAVYDAYSDLERVDEYLTLSRYFSENYQLRKNNPFTGEGKWVQGIYAEEAWGHCVRFFYFSSALADLNILDGSDTYYTLKKRWESVQTKTYITGGMGLDGYSESFGDAYDLDNDKSYCETCASIASTLFSKRMNLLYDDARYFDSIETQLYNNIISGIGLDGDTFYYENELNNLGGVTRPEWYHLPCCPTNLMRYIQSLGGYIYAKAEDELTVNLYIGSNTESELGGTRVAVSLNANMPWSGEATLTVDPETDADFTLKLRIPSWAKGNNRVTVNGQSVEVTPAENGYLYITRTWSAGDLVEISLPMEVEIVDDSDKISTNKNQLAVRRGPIVYAAEQPDNEADINLVTISKDSLFTPCEEVLSTLRQGSTDTYGTHSVITLTTRADTYSPIGIPTGETTTLKLIPFYCWANREKAPMRVYLQSSISMELSSIGLDRFITPTASYHFVTTNQEDLPAYVNDGKTDGKRWTTYHSESYPVKSTDAWIEYTLDEGFSATVSSCSIWWYDDGGGVQTPDSMEILYFDGAEYKSVVPTAEYTFEGNKYNEYSFEPVTTTKIRLHITSEVKNRGMGIVEWTLEGILCVGDEVSEVIPSGEVIFSTVGNSLRKESEHTNGQALRFKISLPQGLLQADYSGYQLVEYGVLAALESSFSSPVLSDLQFNGITKGIAYKRPFGEQTPTRDIRFDTTDDGAIIISAAIYNISVANYSLDYLVRPYAIFENKNGDQLVRYGSSQTACIFDIVNAILMGDNAGDIAYVDGTLLKKEDARDRYEDWLAGSVDRLG